VKILLKLVIAIAILIVVLAVCASVAKSQTAENTAININAPIIDEYRMKLFAPVLDSVPIAINPIETDTAQTVFITLKIKMAKSDTVSYQTDFVKVNENE